MAPRRAATSNKRPRRSSNHSQTITEALNGARDGTYTRSAALFDRAERRLEQHPTASEKSSFAIRDLKLIDGTLAKLAELIGLKITDHDTARIAQ